MLDGPPVPPDTKSDAEMLDYFNLTPMMLTRLQALGGRLDGQFEPILDQFYEKIAKRPALSALLAQAGGTAGLKKAQKKHWQVLFQTLGSEDFKERAVRVGMAHERIGLDPEMYLGGYRSLAVEMINLILADARKPAQARADIEALLSALFYDISLSLTAYVKQGAITSMRDEILTISDMLEREATNTVGEISHKAAKFHQISKQVSRRSRELENIVNELARTSEDVSKEIQTVAAAATELEALSTGINQSISRTTDASGSVMDRTHEAADSVAKLSDAAERISKVVELIRDISGKTRLLALNATIEAARAGDAGKGFAVVAHEVKGLANQTESSIGDVAGRTDDIRNGTTSTVRTMDGVADAIKSMDAITAEIADASEEQRNASADIARSMEQAAVGAGHVAHGLTEISTRTEENNASAKNLAGISGLLNADMETLRSRILGIVATSTVKEDHLHLPVALDAELGMGSTEVESMIVDLSLAGALVRPKGTQEFGLVPMGTQLQLTSQAFGSFPVRALMPSGNAIHVQFEHLAEDRRTAIRDHLLYTKTRDDGMFAACKGGAGDISRLFDDAVRMQKISKDDLFDEDYVPVPDTAPQQFDSKACAFLDETLPKVQERMLDIDGAVFCVSIDRNGFIPTHNNKYTNTQKPGDIVYNTGKCRQRRMWDDRAGLLSAHNISEKFFHTYGRDMGGGEIVFLKEVDCPIRVGGEIWGNLRLGYMA